MGYMEMGLCQPFLGHSPILSSDSSAAGLVLKWNPIQATQLRKSQVNTVKPSKEKKGKD